MKQLLYIFSFLIGSYLVQGQTTPIQTIGVPGGRVEARGQFKIDSLGFMGKFNGFPVLTVNSDTIGAYFLNIADRHIYYRDTIPLGGHQWSQVSTSADIPNYNAVLAQGGRITAPRSVSLAQTHTTFDSAAVVYNKVDSPAIRFNPIIPGNIIFFTPWLNYLNALTFCFRIDTANNGDGTYNTPFTIGWNNHQSVLPNAWGAWDSWEPHFVFGALQSRERHYEIAMPSHERCRLFSSTFTFPTNPPTDSLKYASNQWDFRIGGTGIFHVEDLTSTNDILDVQLGSLVLGGNVPFFRLSDYISGTSANITYQSSTQGITIDNTLQLLSNSNNNNLRLHNDASTGSSNIYFQRPDGNIFALQLQGPGALNADEFLLHDYISNDNRLRITKAGKFITGSSGTSDNGNIFQNYGTGFFSDTLKVPNLTISGHYIQNTNATIAAGAGAGTSPTVGIVGSDQSGLITVTTGTLPGISSTVVTVTYATAFPTNSFPLLTPANAATALLSGASMVFTTGSTTTFIITSGTTALAPATAYRWYYSVGGN